MRAKRQLVRWSAAVALLAVTPLGALIGHASVMPAPQPASCPPPTPGETEIFLDANDPANASHVALTEQYHFTPEVEQLVKGSSSVMPMDIDFTLRHHPNHYRALWAMARWQLLHRIPPEYVGKALPSECYFQRAIAFRPDDAQLYVLYAMSLHRAGRLEEAEAQYGRAEAIGANSAEYFYNRGLLELDLGHIDNAQAFADKAYSAGYPLPGLRNRLAKAKGAGH